MTRLTRTDFKPAKPWSWLIALAALLNRVVIGRHTKLDVRPDDLALLRSLPPGCLIAPNHAHHADPQVTFELTRRAARRVIFMATREAFDACNGWWGWCLQHLGAFSVNRGAPNAEALNFARAILTTGAHDLLMFPEGEVYLLNDVVMPLKPGVARLALEAAVELERQGRPRPVFLVPVAIKYRFLDDMKPALDAKTAELETQVLGGSRTGPLYPRILALGTEILARAEDKYGVTPDLGLDVYERVRRLRRTLLEGLERRYIGRVRDAFDFDRARKLMIRIQGRLQAQHGTVGYYGSSSVVVDDPLTADLEAANLCARSVAFRDDYLAQDPTPERMAETLTKIEREILGRPIRTSLGKRRAIIRVAPPLDVREYLAGHKAGPIAEAIIEAVVIRLQESLQNMLDAIARAEQEQTSC